MVYSLGILLDRASGNEHEAKFDAGGTLQIKFCKTSLIYQPSENFLAAIVIAVSTQNKVDPLAYVVFSTHAKCMI